MKNGVCKRGFKKLVRNDGFDKEVQGKDMGDGMALAKGYKTKPWGKKMKKSIGNRKNIKNTRNWFEVRPCEMLSTQIDPEFNSALFKKNSSLNNLVFGSIQVDFVFL